MKRILISLVIALACSACGVQSQDRARAIDQVPFGLLDPSAPEPPEVVDTTEGTAVQIFLVDPSGAQLTMVDRKLSVTDLPAVMAALVRGPTRAEVREGLLSALGEAAQQGTVELVGGVASVNLPATFATVDGPTQRLAIAQIVLTLTGRPGVGRVSFTLEGQPIDIPRGGRDPGRRIGVPGQFSGAPAFGLTQRQNQQFNLWYLLCPHSDSPVRWLCPPGEAFGDPFVKGAVMDSESNFRVQQQLRSGHLEGRESLVFVVLLVLAIAIFWGFALWIGLGVLSALS